MTCQPVTDNLFMPPTMDGISATVLARTLRDYHAYVRSLGDSSSPSRVRMRQSVSEAIAAIERELDRRGRRVELTA